MKRAHKELLLDTTGICGTYTPALLTWTEVCKGSHSIKIWYAEVIKSRAGCQIGQAVQVCRKSVPPSVNSEISSETIRITT